MEKELVTVIITTYERPEKLKKAVNSVLEQDYENIEIVVVDDNDENSIYRKETKLIMEEWRDNNKIRYIMHSKNSGGCKARNTGLEHSKGEYISFLDDDDEFIKGKISKEVKLMREEGKDERIAFILSEMSIINLSGIEKITDRKKLFDNNISYKDFLKKHILRECGYGYVGTSALFFKKKCLEKIGGFPYVRIRQEYLLMLKIFEAGYTGLYLDAVTVKINVSEGGVTRRYSKEKERDIYKVYIEQKKQFNEFTFSEKIRVKINYYKDILKYLIFTKRYARILLIPFSKNKEA